MSIRLSNLRVGIDEPEAGLRDEIVHALGVDPSALAHWRILRKSLDVRNKANVHFVYTVEASLNEDESRAIELANRSAHGKVRAELYQEPPFTMPAPGSCPLPHPPVVVG